MASSTPVGTAREVGPGRRARAEIQLDGSAASVALYLDPEANEAEFALLVGDAFQRQGLGRHLLERLVAVARERGIGKLVGDVLAENAPMLALVAQLGFRATPSNEASVVRVECVLL